MSKRNVMAALNITPDGSMPKNSYDLHSYEYFTHKLGQFIPVGCRETVPDGTYDIGIDAYTLTFPCQTASMADMKENYYFIFVPYSQIVNSSYSFFTQRKDVQSALDYSNEQVPWFPLGDVVYHCVINSLTQPTYDVHGYNLYTGALRLLDMLGYGCYLDLLQVFKTYTFNASTALRNLCDKLNTYKPNVLRIAAYQKAWYCYFRNKQYDVNISPRAFNFDDVAYHVAGVPADWNILSHRSLDHFVKECLQLRYVPYKKDLFTASMPGTQYGAVSSVTLKNSLVHTGSTSNDYSRWFNLDASPFEHGKVVYTSPYSTPSLNDDLNDGNTILHTHSFTSAVPQGATLFDVLQLVESQAIQKWKQKSMLAGQRMQDQYKAHYGVVPRHLEDHYPDFIGSVDNVIDIDKVVNQANTVAADDMTNLGDLGGRGYGVSSRRTFRYHASEHGVIMVFKAVVPENLYGSFGLDRANQLINYTDFYQPEFQNIGLEAVPKTLLDPTALFDSNSMEEQGQDSTLFDVDDLILGYAPRNYQLKQYPSRTHGMFNPTRCTDMSQPGSRVPFGFSDMQSFVQPRPDLVSRLRFVNDPNDGYLFQVSHLEYTLSKFYVNPAMANYTFAVDADKWEDSDCFACKALIICNAVQPLTPLGLPQF